jgi:hypothetical protein
MKPSTFIFYEAFNLGERARKYAESASYGSIVLALLYQEDRSNYGWLEFRLKAFDIRRQIKRELKLATRLNNNAERTLARARRMEQEEVNDAG